MTTVGVGGGGNDEDDDCCMATESDVRNDVILLLEGKIGSWEISLVSGLVEA